MARLETRIHALSERLTNTFSQGRPTVAHEALSVGLHEEVERVAIGASRT
jgi:hypothetical protein